MRLVTEEETREMKVVNVGKGRFDLRDYGPDVSIIHMVPTELHFKEDGALDDRPSLLVVLSHPTVRHLVVGEMSLSTLSRCLEDLGYEIRKK